LQLDKREVISQFYGDANAGFGSRTRSGALNKRFGHAAVSSTNTNAPTIIIRKKGRGDNQR
jgi:hypothetical protein